MSKTRRLLLTSTSARNSTADLPTPEIPMAADSDVVVILAALLCAVICVVGLALVARCAWIRRRSPPGAPPSPPPKGIKKKVLGSLPKLSFHEAFSSSAGTTSGGKLSSDCAICLAEFADGDEIRVLPQCGHGFHVECVDTWLGSHSSCPSCRQVLVVVVPSAAGGRCQRCGASSDGAATTAPAASAAEGGAKAREDGDDNRFLP